ncbi:MAG: geranylgeranyl reductase family protein [Candidatus Bathyarchaeota archaeon]|nr:MAG: geranylgeranyl reductase family protein [Candidatus Bathyarchaeota archaeon]
MEVVIVGGGPAGGVAAKKLSDDGYDVTLFEKERIPRHKHCAGFISQKSIRLLESTDIDIRDILSELKGLHIRCGDATMELKLESLAGNVIRDEFDSHLIRRARDSGAKIVDASRVVDISRGEDGKYLVQSEKKAAECDVVIGADGVNSFVRRHLGIQYDRSNLGVTVEAEIPVGAEAITEFKETNHYDIGYVPNGYGWIFPKTKSGTVNAGLWIPRDDVKKLDQPLSAMFSHYIGNHDLSDQKVVPHTYLIPYKGTVDRFGEGNIILIGDAAGFVGIAGEGIPYAVESGFNAAEAVKKHNSGNASLEEEYRSTSEGLMEEINEYHVKFNRFFFNPTLFRRTIKLVEKDEYISSLMKKLTDESTSLKEIYRNISYSKLLLAFLKSLP